MRIIKFDHEGEIWVEVQGTAVRCDTDDEADELVLAVEYGLTPFEQIDVEDAARLEAQMAEFLRQHRAGIRA